MIFDQSKALQKKSHALIPGGAHTYAKADDQYPEKSPGFLVRGEGCHVWDIDGNEFIEYGMGLRSVTLGHGYKPVVEAAYRQMQMGINFTRPSPIEVECAEKLASFIKSAEMVKFGKNGSDATSAALKLARAYTGRDMVGISTTIILKASNHYLRNILGKSHV
jgi:glutamate-1-semialdehyde 2,1-aminomutase